MNWGGGGGVVVLQSGFMKYRSQLTQLWWNTFVTFGVLTLFEGNIDYSNETVQDQLSLLANMTARSRYVRASSVNPWIWNYQRWARENGEKQLLKLFFVLVLRRRKDRKRKREREREREREMQKFLEWQIKFLAYVHLGSSLFEAQVHCTVRMIS